MSSEVSNQYPSHQSGTLIERMTSHAPSQALSKGRPSTLASSERFTTRLGSGFPDDRGRHARSKIFGEFASKDYNTMKSNIVLFPLSFIDSYDEAKFFSRILQAFHIRARLSAIASFIMYGLYWICVAICLANNTFPSSGKTARIVFSLCMAVVTLSSWFPYIASSYTIFRKYTEISVYVVVLLTAVMIGGWMILNALLEYGNNLLAIVQFQRTKIWVNVFVYIIPFWGCMLMDIVMQARTKTSFLVHVLNFGIFTIANVVQTGIFVQKSKKSRKINLHQKEFMILSTLLDCFFALCISLFLFSGRWFLELQERIEFLRRMKATEQIRRLKEQTAKKKRKKGATVIEDVLSLVERVVNNVEEVLVESNLPSLAEGAELLKQCQEILTETDNLYSVRYQSKGQGDEVEALEEQFFQIYADKQFLRLPTRVRFGEVTGIQFDASAATQDISKSGQLTSPPTLRSFGLLHLHDPTKKIHVTDHAPSPTLCQTDIIRIGRDWETDILKLGQKHENILLEVGAALLGDKIEGVRASVPCLLNYLKRLQDTYPANPYHNQIHGATVAHATSCLMRMLCIYEAADHSGINDIAITIAALGHDAGHPARNNQFFVNTCDPLALLYSDSGVLENAHSAITFKCLESTGANIFADITPDLFRSIRKRIIELILATDMGQHFESVSRFRLRRQAAGFNYLEDLDDMWHVIRMCIKCADLSHALVDWPQHLDWSLRVAEEFYQQGEDEAAFGFKISPLCDRNAHNDLAKSQKGFIEFVVQPLISQMEELEHGTVIGVECVRRLMYNKYKWEEWAKDSYSVPMPEFPVRTDSMNCLKTLVSLFAEGQQLVPIHNEGSQIILGDDSLISDKTLLTGELEASVSNNEEKEDGDRYQKHNESASETVDSNSDY